MKSSVERDLNRFFESHHGVIDRRHALEMGVDKYQLVWALRSGRWETVRPGVYQRAGVPLTPLGAALAACWALGPAAVVSHRSAALAWTLVTEPPPKPSISIPVGHRGRQAGVEVHRRDDIDAARTVSHRALAVTDPLRTLADLGQVASPAVLDAAIDRAVVLRLVGIPALEAEVARLARPGRQGPGQLRRALQRRGFVEAPTSSVLESRVGRLLRRWRIPVLGVETVVVGGRYRLDFSLRPDVALEVDGYAYHWSPEAKSADAGRRAALAAAGITVIEADWVLVQRRPDELRNRILPILARPAA